MKKRAFRLTIGRGFVMAFFFSTAILFAAHSAVAETTKQDVFFGGFAVHPGGLSLG